MKRKDFLKNGSLASIAITALAATSCNESAKKAPAPTTPAQSVTAADEFPLNEITIDTLQQKMQAGDYTAQSITGIYLSRIEAIDKKGPAINSVIELNPDAMAIAMEMDKERKAGKIRGPLRLR